MDFFLIFMLACMFTGYLILLGISGGPRRWTANERDGNWHWYGAWLPRFVVYDPKSLGGGKLCYPNQRRYWDWSGPYTRSRGWEYRNGTNLLDEHGKFDEDWEETEAGRVMIHADDRREARRKALPSFLLTLFIIGLAYLLYALVYDLLWVPVP